MSEPETPIMRHVIAALVTNEPGVLAQVAGMFAARGFNIDSLVVGRTENPELSRMTIVVNGDDAVLEQIRKQLQKLVPVVKVVDYQDAAHVERDLMLVQVTTTHNPSNPNQDPNQDPNQGRSQRSELIELARLFRAKVVDVSPDQLMIEMAGTEDKVEAFIQMIQPFGIIELARTGVIAMPRGLSSGRSSTPPRTGTNQGQSPGPDIDVSDLPPG